jgi:hypothetical protein
MRLSEAIRLGALLITDKPAMADIRTCAMGMANIATNGYAATCERDLSAWDAFRKTFPWTDGASANCPLCGEKLKNQTVVYHCFDHHVCDGKMTIEQLADFISTIEPQETPEEKREIVENFCEQLVEQR